jgi:hypothetical protein
MLALIILIVNCAGVAQSKPTAPSYPNTSAGLESMMNDMTSLQKRNGGPELEALLEGLVLPHPEEWFTSEFGNVRCAEAQLAANDCLGPRLALAYSVIAQNLPASFALTLKDLIAEDLATFEVANYSEECPGPIRIEPDVKLVGSLSTTPTMAELGQKHEPVYVVWSYGKTKQTTLGFFVYADGAFRYVGMPHPASIEEFRAKSMGQAAASSAPRYLSEDQLEMKNAPLDSEMIQRAVVVRVVVDRDGKPKDVTFVRGCESCRDAAIENARKRKFEPPGFGPRGFHPGALCVNVVTGTVK